MRFLVLAMVIALVAIPAPERLAAQGGGMSGDVFDDWSQQAARSIAVAGYPAPVVNIYMAIAHLAIYDAVVSITGRYAPFYAVVSSPGGSIEAAVATAAHDVLIGLFPAQKAELDSRLATSLAGIAEGRGKRVGVAAGAGAAQATLKARAGDGRFASVPYTPGTLPGMWAPTPPANAAYVFPWIGSVKPFGIRFPSQFRPPGPPAMDSAKYAEEYNEVKRLGGRQSTVRTAEQGAIGVFWQTDFMFNRSLLALASMRGVGIADKARLFAMTWTSIADSIIGVWNAKSYYSFWRPIQAIRRAEEDGNPATEPDASWEPLLPTAPYPEYPSGHLAVDSALAEAIETFFGTKALPLVFENTTNNTTRRYAGTEELLKEIIEARIYIGFHFRSADVDSVLLGRRTARYILERQFLPTSR